MSKTKSQAELEIEALQDVFNISTSGFEAFYKEAKSKGTEAASSGDYSKAASSGDSSKAASSGNSSKAASSGNFSKAASSGNFSTASCAGENSGCSALGYRAAVSGELGNLIMASEYDQKGKPLGGKADLIDGKKLKPNRWYIVEKSEWVEVDFTDGVFTYVLSNKKGVKKVKTENGDVLYIVTDENGNSAHGSTIKEAREDLIYKVINKGDVKIPKKATGKEWIGIYRAVTGACAAGVRNFVESKGVDLEKEFTPKQIAKLVEGQFGADKFADKLKKET